jgi:hypothetical protein
MEHMRPLSRADEYTVTESQCNVLKSRVHAPLCTTGAEAEG